MSLNLFPARIPTGRFRGPDGKDVDVFATPEFFRALSDVFARIGGTNGIANDELALFTILAPVASIAAPDVVNLDIQGAEQDARLFSMDRVMAEMQMLSAAVTSLLAEVQSLQQAQASAAMDPGYRDQFRVDWERPGKVGLLTANTGAFTTLTASAAVALSPANANVALSPTGTGVVTIAPATVGSIDNMNIGATTRGAVAGTTGNFNTSLTLSGGVLTTLGGATFHTTSTALTNGAGVGAGTIANAPAAGNPTKWIGVNDNGTTRWIPAW